MKFKKHMGMSLACALLMSMPVAAQELNDHLKVSGFVDTAYYNDNAVGTVGGGVTLDQVELDIEYNEGHVGLRFDLNVFPVNNAVVSSDSLIEQGYLTYTMQQLADDGVIFTFGKFNAPIGWELLDAPDMYQYSHAMVFNKGLPTNITGAMLSGSVGIVDAVFYLGNGTDLNAVNAGGMHTYGTRIGFTPVEDINLGVSYLVGDNNAGTALPANKRFTTVDVDASYTGIENLILGGEYNSSTNWTGVNQDSTGWFITSHYDFTDMFGATLRYGTFDADKKVLGQKTAITVAATAALGGGLGALFEYRVEKDSVVTVVDVASYAFEMTYGF
ncbi:MAG: outer membrane beta-barrel protein [Mariprofundaceae bacterium]|nr:outer membrane beta-barrel protein [Mariprofundaceae bacterium]